MSHIRFTTRALVSAIATVMIASAGMSALAGPTPAPVPQIVVDNDDPGFSRNGFDTTSSAGSRDHYGTDYRHSGDPGTLGGQWARWTPTIEAAGTYRVFMRWNSFANRPAAVPVTVAYDGGGQTWTSTVDQRANSLNWYYLGEFELVEGTGNHVEITDAGGPFTTADAVKFVKAPADDSASPDYADDFDDEPVGADPSHWVESHLHDDWQVARDGRDTVYRHLTQNTRSPITWLHVFEQDVDVTAKVKVRGHADAGASIGLPVRYNTPESQIYAGYDFDSRTWQIRERRGADFDWETLAESPAEDLVPNTWHTLRVTAHNGEVALYVDDLTTPKVFTDEAEHRSPGRVALEATGAQALFDDVELTLETGQGRVEDGVMDFTLKDGDGVYREGASVVERANGDVMIRHRDELFRSEDDGTTFSLVDNHAWPDNPFTHHSFLRLRSGKLLTMVSEVEQPPVNEDPPNRFRAVTSADDGKTWQPGGLTWEEYREWTPDKAASIVMNDKLSQSSTGRIFYTVTFRRNVGSVVGHNMEIYYSDDDGQSWAKAPGDSDDWAGRHVEFGEGKVIEADDGSLRLYTPYNDTDSIMQSVSTDGGLTWTGDELTPGLMQSRSSFGVAASPDEENPVYYLVWVFNDRFDHSTSFLPRSRLGLSTSTDGITWNYAMDLDRWVSPRGSDHRPIVQFVDPGVTVTDDYVYVTSGRSEAADPENHNGQRLRVYRVDRDAINPHDTWPAEF